VDPSLRALASEAAPILAFRRSEPRQPARWFAGLTWKGLALIVLLCAFNALRRGLPSLIENDTSIGMWPWTLLELFGTSLIMVLLMTFALVAAYNRTPRAPQWRYPALTLALLVSSAAGTAIMLAVESRGLSKPDFFVSVERLSIYWLPSRTQSLWWWVMSTWPKYAILGLLIAAVFVFFRVREESEAATRKAELDRALFARQMDEAQLQMLQAQIEPHFLFNTLAIVRRLYQTDSAAAESMLDHLMRYLAVALPQMRAAHSTLGREAALARSYLEIQRIRMGPRLKFAVEIPEALQDAPAPPLMLLTLVENAVKHGVSPMPGGGFVGVSARVQGTELRLQVTDSGQGFTRTSGNGTGLANTRARLAAMYGSSARLDIGFNHPSGVAATITLPYAATAHAAAAR
jgi:signal transduction histidine kinase